MRYGGTGHLLRAENTREVQLQALVLDGRNRPLGNYVGGLLQTRNTPALILRNCVVTDSAQHTLSLETTGGSISCSKLANAQQSAIYGVQSSGLRVADNDISNCSNGGILVHRWETGSDGSIILGNRINGINAQAGGTGQNGNGISIANFLEGGRLAVVSNNLIRNLSTEATYKPEVAGFGFGIAAEADTIVTGNVIETASKFGILLG